jgi:uncharacterized protein (DUF2147 family)
MKKLYILAALLMATTSAHAGGMTLQINGERIRVEAPRNCSALSCIKITAPGYSGTIGNIDLKGLGSKSKDEDVADTTPAQPAPAPAQAAAPPSAAPIATPPAPAPAPAPATAASTAPAQVAPPAPTPAPAPATAAAAAPASQPAPVAAAAATSPLGIWATEDNKGNVRIEECGTSLCGYAVNSNEKILINMKPQGRKWTGRIHDPDSNRNYDSTIALKGPNTLKVQGCAFGGMFCGGQTWKRVS